MYVDVMHACTGCWMVMCEGEPHILSLNLAIHNNYKPLKTLLVNLQTCIK